MCIAHCIENMYMQHVPCNGVQVMEYVQERASLCELTKAVKEWERKVEISKVHVYMYTHVHVTMCIHAYITCTCTTIMYTGMHDILLCTCAHYV